MVGAAFSNHSKAENGQAIACKNMVDAKGRQPPVVGETKPSAADFEGILFAVEQRLVGIGRGCVVKIARDDDGIRAVRDRVGDFIDLFGTKLPASAKLIIGCLIHCASFLLADFIDIGNKIIGFCA